jgi:S-DNA-T family DNA segregation ATPase FtsK/SpoIIIE
VEVLPAAVSLAALPPAVGMRLSIGVGGDELDPVVVDLAEGGLLIGGPPRSGRSNALLALARQLGLPVVAVAPRPSPLRQLPSCVTEIGAADELVGLLDTGPAALLIDDAELLVDSPLAPVLERAVRHMRDGAPVVVAAGTTDDLVSGYRGFVVDLRRSRRGILLSPQSTADGDLLGIRLGRSSAELRPGRGLLARRGRVEPLQLALAG